MSPLAGARAAPRTLPRAFLARGIKNNVCAPSGTPLHLKCVVRSLSHPDEPAFSFHLGECQTGSNRPATATDNTEYRSKFSQRHFPVTPFELSRLRGGRYAYAKGAAASATE